MSSEGMEAPIGPEAIFDCNVFLRGTALDHGPAHDRLELLVTGAYTLFRSRDVLEETQDVLTRPALRQRFPLLTAERVSSTLSRIEAHAILVYNVPETFRYPRDPKDEPYINLALVTNAQYLVTYDNDLLDLLNEQTEQGRQFRHQFPHLTILDPMAFLQVLRRL